MTKTAYVTGATGFLGWHIADQLLDRGWQVIALHRPTANTTFLDRLNVTKAEGDIIDRPSLERTMPEGVDAVFHVAGHTGQWAGHNEAQNLVNIDGTRNMVEVALAKNAGRFIHTSSISAYARRGDCIVDEETESLAEDSSVNYERTKWLAEVEVRKGIEKGLDAVILNPAGILGPGDIASWARSFFLARDGKIPGAPPGGGSFCDVREVARMHLEAYERGRTGDNFLLGGESVAYADLLTEIGRLVGKDMTLREVPGWVLKTMARLNATGAMVTGKEPGITPEIAATMSGWSRCSSEKAQRELGFVDKPWRDSLKDSYDWLEQEGLI